MIKVMMAQRSLLALHLGSSSQSLNWLLWRLIGVQGVTGIVQDVHLFVQSPLLCNGESSFMPTTEAARLRKPKYPEETHTNSGRTCKLHFPQKSNAGQPLIHMQLVMMMIINQNMEFLLF